MNTIPYEVQTLSVEDTARAIGVHPETLRRWIREGRFPAVRLGGKVRVLVRELDTYLEEHSTVKTR